MLETPTEMLAFERGPLRDGRRLIAIHNVTDTPQPLAALASALGDVPWPDIVTRKTWAAADSLPPYGVLWLVSDE